MRHTNKIRLLACAMLLTSQIGTASAAVTPQDAQAIVSLVDGGNYIGLRDYITANPQVMTGDGMLAQYLRQFMAQMNVIDSAGVIRLDSAVVRRISDLASIY